MAERWHDAEIDILRDAVMHGRSEQFIARVLGRSVKAISQKKVKLKIRKREAWSFEDEKTLGKMWRKGFSMPEICEALGRSYKSISAKTVHLGLPSRPKKKKVTVSLDPKVIKHLEQLSKREGVAISAYLRNLIMQEIYPDIFEKRSTDVND